MSKKMVFFLIFLTLMMGILYLGFSNLNNKKTINIKSKVTQTETNSNLDSSPDASSKNTETDNLEIKPENEVNPIDNTPTERVQKSTSLTLEQKAKADSVKQLVSHIKAIFATMNSAKARPDKSTSGLIETNKILIGDLKLLNKEFAKMTFMPCAKPTFKKMHTGLNQFIVSLNDIKRSSFIQDNYIKNKHFQKAIDYYDARDSCEH